jgi:hypothetical protein
MGKVVLQANASIQKPFYAAEELFDLLPYG